MKLDETLPHLRASAGFYADVQADERRLYLEDRACDNCELFRASPDERARRVKKICLWHIFSQSGEQAMLFGSL